MSSHKQVWQKKFGKKAVTNMIDDFMKSYSEIEKQEAEIVKLKAENEELRSQLHAWPGGPTWRELVDVAVSGSEGSCVFKSLVANHFELSHEEVDTLCAALNRDPDTDEKIGW